MTAFKYYATSYDQAEQVKPMIDAIQQCKLACIDQLFSVLLDTVSNVLIENEERSDGVRQTAVRLGDIQVDERTTV